MAAGPIELVIFDCDGVLVEALDVAGVSMGADEAAERFLGKSLKTMSEILHDEYGLAIDDHFLEGMRKTLYARFREELQPIENIRQVVEALPVSCCVASSSQPERIRLSLSVTGLIDCFEPNIFSASMVRNGKPAPDLFLHASEVMGVPPDACVVIEDSPAGVMAAQAAGMRVCAFAGGSHARTGRHRAALSVLKPDVLFDDMRELLQFVGNAQPTGT